MSIDPKIKQKANDIRAKIYGREVRESLASGLEVMSEDVEEIKGRQESVESQFQAVLDETTGKDVVSAPEIIAARVSAKGEQHNNLKERLDKEFNEVSAQLAKTAENLYVQRNNLETYIPVSKTTPKAIYNQGGHIFVITQKPNGNGYVRFRLRDGITTTTQSVGAPAELLRVIEVLNVREAFTRVYQDSLNSSSEDWSNSSSDYLGTQLETRTTTPAGSKKTGVFIEYDVEIPDGVSFIQTLILASNGSSDNVEIAIDGEVVSNKSFKGSGWKRITTPITPGTHKIRFTTVNAGYMSIAGTNVMDLNMFKLGSSYDKLFVDVQFSDNEYITNSGSMDYAMVDADTGLYCGSYHGGETRSRLQYMVDGQTVTVNDGELHVGNVIEIEQETNIVSKLDAFVRQIFRLDGTRELEVIFDGKINLTLLFTNMTTTSNKYTEVIYPNRIDTIEDRNYYLRPGANYVIQRNPSNNQKIITVMNNNVFPIGEMGRTPYVKGMSGTTAGLYNKLYKANIDSSTPVEFTGGAFRTIHIFE